MRKLGKKIHDTIETIESYACTCSGLSKCGYPACSCPSNDNKARKNQRDYKHMTLNNDVYNSTSASERAK